MFSKKYSLKIFQGILLPKDDDDDISYSYERAIQDELLRRAPFGRLFKFATGKNVLRDPALSMNDSTLMAEEQGNPVHIAKVLEIARSSVERLKALAPSSTLYDLEELKELCVKVGDENRKQWISWVEKQNKKIDLRGADFRNLSLLGLIFDDAIMTGANFEAAALVDCSLRDTKLCDANFTDAKLTLIDFEGACLDGANFTRAQGNLLNIKSALLGGTNFTDAIIAATSVDRTTDFTNATFTNCTLKKKDLLLNVPFSENVKQFRDRLSPTQRSQLSHCILFIHSDISNCA